MQVLYKNKTNSLTLLNIGIVFFLLLQVVYCTICEQVLHKRENETKILTDR